MLEQQKTVRVEFKQSVFSLYPEGDEDDEDDVDDDEVIREVMCPAWEMDKKGDIKCFPRACDGLAS